MARSRRKTRRTRRRLQTGGLQRRPGAALAQAWRSGEVAGAMKRWENKYYHALQQEYGSEARKVMFLRRLFWGSAPRPKGWKRGRNTPGIGWAAKVRDADDSKDRIVGEVMFIHKSYDAPTKKIQAEKLVGNEIKEWKKLNKKLKKEVPFLTYLIMRAELLQKIDQKGFLNNKLIQIMKQWESLMNDTPVKFNEGLLQYQVWAKTAKKVFKAFTKRLSGLFSRKKK